MSLAAHPADVGQMKIMKIKKILLTFLALLVVHSLVYAYEPPWTPPKDALLNGKIAFIARITEIKEISHAENISEALAKAKILKPLYGLPEPISEYIYIKYSSRYFMPIPYHGFPADFYISRVYLIVTNRPSGGKPENIYFNPTFEKNIDLAYEIVSDHGFSIQDLTSNHRLLSVYSNMIFKNISIQNLLDWSLSRDMQLDK